MMFLENFEKDSKLPHVDLLQKVNQSRETSALKKMWNPLEQQNPHSYQLLYWGTINTSKTSELYTRKIRQT